MILLPTMKAENLNKTTVLLEEMKMAKMTKSEMEKQLESNANNFNVELISNDETIHRTEWKITRADGVYTYSLTKTGNDYHLRLDGEYEKFYCLFYMIDGDICIECGEHNGKHLNAASRLKAFSQIVMSMWGLIQVGKIS